MRAVPAVVLLALFGAGCGEEPVSPDAATDGGAVRDGEPRDVAAVDGPAVDGDVPVDARVDDAALDATIAERCLPQAVGGEGGCTDLIAIYWNGLVCSELYGCSCTGTDCPSVYGTFAECWSARRGCPGLCGSQRVVPVGTTCDVSWGPYWLGPAGCDPFVACDCMGEDCDRPYVDKPACERANRGCTGRCGPQGATGMGDCARDLGVVWDGAACVSISGCSCTGAECVDVYGSVEDCVFAHRGCWP